MSLFSRLLRAGKPHPKSDDGKLAQLIDRHGIGFVVDVGANIGQTRDRLRRIGYGGRIVSVEPLSRAHGVLCEKAATDPNWDIAPRMALGGARGEAEILVSAADDLSSLKAPVATLENALPRAEATHRETVTVETLDGLWATLKPQGPVLLKLDTQGNEAEILAGGADSLKHVAAILIELSLVPLYEGEKDYLSVGRQLDELGFEPVLFIPGYFSRATGRLLQMDGFFVRKG